MFEDKICLWRLHSNCSIIACPGKYLCECVYLSSLDRLCEPEIDCPEAACFANCPSWNHWSPCLFGVQHRHRACKCDVESRSRQKVYQYNSTCFEEQDCRTLGYEYEEMKSAWVDASYDVLRYVIPILVVTLVLTFLIAIISITFMRRKGRHGEEREFRTKNETSDIPPNIIVEGPAPAIKEKSMESRDKEKWTFISFEIIFCFNLFVLHWSVLLFN